MSHWKAKKILMINRCPCVFHRTCNRLLFYFSRLTQGDVGHFIYLFDSLLKAAVCDNQVTRPHTASCPALPQALARIRVRVYACGNVCARLCVCARVCAQNRVERWALNASSGPWAAPFVQVTSRRKDTHICHVFVFKIRHFDHNHISSCIFCKTHSSPVRL